MPSPTALPPEEFAKLSLFKQYVFNLERLFIIAGIALFLVGIIWAVASFSTPPESAVELQEEVEAAEEELKAETEAKRNSEEGAANQTNNKIYGSGTINNFDQTCLTENRLPTIHSLLVLDGSSLETMLQTNGWSYNTEKKAWVNADKTALLSAYDRNGWMTDDQIAVLGRAGSAKAVYTLSVSQEAYPSAQLAFNALSCADYIDFEAEDDTGLVLVKDSEDNELLCLYTTNSSQKNYSLFVASDPAIAAGYFNSVTGGNYGSSPREVFSQLSGHEVKAD